ncbi:MAG TPA: BON domain-containing protein [Gemmataceae bacterium]|nr:BON domain-containing protein [Gemmataceae bacterium]
MATATPPISRAAQALKQSTHPALRKLSVEETDSALVITGRVSSYYLKQLAQETLMAVRGERQLVNHVSVVRD